MPFDWQEFLGLAERLLETESEAGYRSAISRAYYSIFNVAIQRARENNCRLEPDVEGGFHKKCWLLYRKNAHPVCQELGIEGSRLFELRVRADYKGAEYRRLRDEATKCIEDVRRLRARLTGLDARYPTP